MNKQANLVYIRKKLIFEFIGRQVEGRENVGCTLKYINNHLTMKRMAEMKKGEAYALLHYFESKQYENPYFFMRFNLILKIKSQIFLRPIQK